MIANKVAKDHDEHVIVIIAFLWHSFYVRSFFHERFILGKNAERIWLYWDLDINFHFIRVEFPHTQLILKFKKNLVYVRILSCFNDQLSFYWRNQGMATYLSWSYTYIKTSQHYKNGADSRLINLCMVCNYFNCLSSATQQIILVKLFKSLIQTFVCFISSHLLNINAFWCELFSNLEVFKFRSGYCKFYLILTTKPFGF